MTTAPNGGTSLEVGGGVRCWVLSIELTQMNRGYIGCVCEEVDTFDISDLFMSLK